MTAGAPPTSSASTGPAAEPPFRVFLDFDGTLVQPNVAILLVERFAHDGARVAHEVDEQLHRGELTLRQAWDRQAALLEWAQIPGMTDFAVREIPLRDGAHQLLALLAERGVPTVVVSGGLDFYIRAILDRERLDLPFVSDTAHPGTDGRLRVEHPHGHHECRQCGICKAQVVRGPLPNAGRTIFVGDGSTDRFAAEVADIVFARGRLLSYCEKRGIPYFPFEDFPPVTAQIRTWLDGAQPPPAGFARGVVDSLCPISRGVHSAIPAGRT